MAFKAERPFLSLISGCHSSAVWADVAILHGGRSLPCHKFVLGTSSRVLHSAFSRTDTGSEMETLVFDNSFSQTEIEELISYVYGVAHKAPQSFSFLFPSDLQVKPDTIKHEVIEPLLEQEYMADIKAYIGHDSFYNDKYDYGNNDPGEYDDDYDDDEEMEFKPSKKVKNGSTSPKKNYKRVTTEEGTKKYECPYCGKHVNKLPIHVEAAHKEMWEDFNASRKHVSRKRNYPKPCPHCPKLLPDKWHYDKHMRTHMEPKERKAALHNFKKEVEEYGNFVCAKCGDNFPNKSALKTHEYKHKNEVACEVKDCNEVFLSYVQFCNHMLFKHQKVIKRRKCYAKIKTGLEDEEKKIDPDDNQQHLCPECGKGYVSENAVRKHMEYMHPINPINTFVCNVCGKNFKNNSKLKNHMLLHEPPTKPCPFCDKLFETNHKVKKHIKSTHVEDDQKLYQCSYCQKGFSRKESYEGHMNDHKNIRPYQCSMCDKAYRNSFDFQQHVKKTHGVNSVPGVDIASKYANNTVTTHTAGFANLVESWNKFG